MLDTDILRMQDKEVFEAIAGETLRQTPLQEVESVSSA